MSHQRDARAAYERQHPRGMIDDTMATLAAFDIDPAALLVEAEALDPEGTRLGTEVGAEILRRIDDRSLLPDDRE